MVQLRTEASTINLSIAAHPFSNLDSESLDCSRPGVALPPSFPPIRLELAAQVDWYIERLQEPELPQALFGARHSFWKLEKDAGRPHVHGSLRVTSTALLAFLQKHPFPSSHNTFRDDRRQATLSTPRDTCTVRPNGAVVVVTTPGCRLSLPLQSPILSCHHGHSWSVASSSPFHQKSPVAFDFSPPIMPASKSPSRSLRNPTPVPSK